MKKLLAFIACAIFAITATAQAPAFPGAEGYGRYVTGGRGGKIVHVTNLNDSGTGSLRAAVNGDQAKIIVFDVGGVIALKSELKIGENTTILGQTAPNPGITLRYYTVRPKTNNIIRFIRIRRGEEVDVNDGADATWQRDMSDIILDHCSFSWSIDEIASFYDNKNFTMQWCTLGEALANPGHTKGEHSYGGIWGGKGASFHHNFLAHMQNRAPRFCGARYDSKVYDKTKYANSIQAEIVDFRNCVMYNWGNGNGCYGGPGGGYINIVNNYYKAGPATSNKTRVTQISVATQENSKGSPFMGYTSRYYINGNYVTAAGANADNYDWKGVIYDSGTYDIDGEKCSADATHMYGDGVTYYKNASGTDCVRIKLDAPVDKGEVTTHSAKAAYEKVLAFAGASLYRDGVDARYMDEASKGITTYVGSAQKTGDGKTITHRPGIIDFVKDQGEYILETTQHPEGFDTDGDGMPNAWETANGLNPNDASDALTTTLDAKGYYTNLEVYANSLVEDIIKGGNEGAADPITEYYPAAAKAEGIPYYDGTAAKGTFGKQGEKPDDPNPGQEGETYTVTFNGSNVQSEEGYFTFNPDKHNFNSKFKGTYNGTDYTKGLKIESATLIQFTTTTTSTVTIVQSTLSEHSIKFDDVALDVASAATPEGSTGVRVYTVNGVAAGQHKITRGSGESGIFAVTVRYGESTTPSYEVTYKDPEGNVLGTKKVYEGDAIGATPYTKEDLTLPDGTVFWGWAYDGSNTWVKATDKVNSDLTVIARVLDTTVSIEPNAQSGYYEVTPDNPALLLAAIKAANSTEGARIFLKNGTYDLGEIVLTGISGKNVSIIGQSAEKTIIVSAPPIAVEGLGKADLLVNTGEGLYLQDITLKNALDYYAAGSAGRAPTLHDKGTKTINKNVRHLSYQDTYYSHKTGGLFYFEGGEIHGTVDYACGNGKVYFNEVTMVNEKRSSATMTANSELYVFNNCTVRNYADSYNFGRAWSDNPVCVYLNTTLEEPQKLASTRWELKGINCDYSLAGEFGTKNAAGENITPASNIVTFQKANTELETILGASALETYSIDKVLGDWAETAQEQARQIDAPADAAYSNGIVSWTAVGGASAYAIFKNDVLVGITTGTSYSTTVDADNESLTIRSANARGGFGKSADVAGTKTGISQIRNDQGSEPFYSLQGIRVSKAGKGIYITNGKKIVIK